MRDRLISKALHDEDYDCGLIGKLHLASAFLRREERVNDGYDYFQYSHDHKGGNERGNEYVEWIKGQGVDHNTRLAAARHYVAGRLSKLAPRSRFRRIQ